VRERGAPDTRASTRTCLALITATEVGARHACNDSKSSHASQAPPRAQQLRVEAGGDERRAPPKP